MSASYTALRSYSDVTLLDDTEKTSSQGEAKLPQIRALVNFAKPNRLAIITTDETGTVRSYLQKNFYYQTRSENPSVYLRRAAPAQDSKAILNTVIYGKLSGVGLFPWLLIGADTLAPVAGRITSLTLDAPGEVDGVAVDNIALTTRLSAGDGEQTVRLSIGKADHLLRQAALVRAFQGKRITRMETHLNVRVNPTLGNDVLAFVPPPGARPVIQFPYLPDKTAGGKGMNPAIPRRRGRGNMGDAARAEEAARGAAATDPPPVTPDAAPSAPVLTILKVDGITLPRPNVGRIDFGEVSALDRPKLEHTFLVRNDGAAPVALKRIIQSDGCRAAIDSSAAPAAPSVGGSPETLPTLQQGEVISVRVSVDLTALPPGNIEQSVVLLTAEPNSRSTLLELGAKRTASVRFFTEVINLRRIPSGETRTEDFTASFDSRMLKGEQSLPLVSTVPHITIEALGPPAASPVATPQAPMSQKWMTQKYRLKVSKDTPRGLIHGHVQVPLKDAATPPIGEAVRNGLPLLPEAAIRVTAVVVGEVTASAEFISFGVTPPRMTQTREMQLVGATSTTFKDAVVTPGAPWLSARLVASRDPYAPKTGPDANTVQMLEVKLLPEAPVGLLRSSVRITLASGTQLYIPVSGFTAENAIP